MSGPAAAGVGTRCPVIGIRGEDNGFRPTANRTIMVRGDPIEDGEVRTVSCVTNAPSEYNGAELYER